MAEEKSKDLYRHPALKPITLPELSDIARDLGFTCSEDELKEFKDVMNHESAVHYGRLMQLVSPTLPVKYPRTPGYKPPPEENKYNAWAWKCNIQGAPEGPLKGKRIGIKDTICVAGVPMTDGSIVMEGYVPEIDATGVTAVLDAGGTILGKTNSEYLCMSGSSWTCCTGPILNPFDTTRVAGGSSSGNAVLLAVNEIDMALGGDQGGSTRIPSCWCGVIGMKPTFGLVPYTGSKAIEITLDHVGIQTRTAADCAQLLEVIAGYDNGLDPRQPRDLQVPKYSKLLTEDLNGKKIGLVTEGFDTCEPDVVDIVKGCANKLTKAGAVVEDVSIPMHADGIHIWAPIFMEGVYKCMIRGNGNGYLWKGFYAESLNEALSRGYKTKINDMSDPMKLLFFLGEYISRNYGNKFYGKCQNMVLELTRAYDVALQKYDVIVMPTLPYKPPKIPSKDSSVAARIKNSFGMTRNTGPFCSTGHPSLTVNAGFSEELPVGMMITGKHFDDATVLQVAHVVEKLRDEK